ncbi:MAG: hypothetical protein HYS04_23165 [Acidobacteria bacterium]|nr:hypothetical protein [Acidobacteriota bacterium]
MRELQELFTPAQDEIGFARSHVRENNEPDALVIVHANHNRRAEWIPAEDIDFSFVSERRWNDVLFRIRNGKREMQPEPA